MMKVVIGLLMLIQQEAETKITEAEKKTSELQRRKEAESVDDIKQFMIVTGVPAFN